MASAAVTVEDQGEGSKSYSLPLTCDRNSLNVNSPTAKDSQLKEQYPSVNDCSVKVRKPYTITKQRERWTEEEHKKFIEGLKIYGRAWQSIEDHVGTKTAVQIRSHAQKFFSKVARESTNSDADSVKPIEIPPPRPKRKPIHPYPRKLLPHAFESETMGTADSYAPKVGISQNSSVVDDKQGSSFLSQLASSLEGEGSSLRVQLTANSLPDEDVSVGLRGISKLNIVLPTCNRISLDVSSHNGKDVQLKEQFPSGNGCAIKVVWESSNSDANSVKPFNSSRTSSKSKLVNPYPCKLVGNSAESEILDPTDSNTPIPCLSPVSSAAHANKGGIFLSQTGSSPEGTGSSFQVQEPACSSPDMKTNAADKKILSNSGTVLLTCKKFSLKAGLQSGPNEQVHSGNGSATKVVHESGNSEAHSVKPTENAALCLKEKVHHAFPCELAPAAFESKTHGTKDSLTPNGSFSPLSSAGDANQAQAGPSPEGTGSSFNIQLPDRSPDGDVPVYQGGSKSSTVLRTCSRTPLDVGTNSGMDIQQEHFHAGIGCALKARKPYTITKQRERWTEEEHGRFIEALKLYGRAWRKIEEHVGTKTAIQIRSHAQKFFSKVVRESVSGDVNSVKTIEIPPPRPKRKPVHPYPRKLAAPFESEMQCTADSKTPNDFLSPVSSAVDANNDCFLYSQPDSSPEGTGSSFQIQQPASSPLDEEVPKSEKLSQEEPPVTTESLADLASTQSLKLFGKTVVVADTKGPSLRTAGTSESSPLDMNGGRPAHIVPWNLVPPVGTWDPSLNYFMQFPNEIPTRADGSVPSLPWCAFYVGLPFPSLQMQNPVVVNPGASVHPGLSEDREVHQEGSYSGSDAGSVNAGEGGDRDWDVEIQSDKVASDNGENEQQTEGGGDFCGKTSPTELKPRPDKCMKGFVPYKRCITERETQSSNMTVQDSDERRIRLCL